MRTLNRDLLEKAQESLIYSGGTPSGQYCHFEASVWHELRAALSAVLKGETISLSESGS